MLRLLHLHERMSIEATNGRSVSTERRQIKCRKETIELRQVQKSIQMMYGKVEER